MPAQVFLGESVGSRVYAVGRVGIDSGTADLSGTGAYSNPYTGILKTERISPAGEDGLCFFQRVALRIWRTGAFSLTMRVWVDDVQTQVWASDGSGSPQTIVISRGSPSSSPEEIVVEGAIRARGTYIQVEISVDSASVTGIFLPETLEVHYLPLRATRLDPMRTAITEVGASIATPGVSAGAGHDHVNRGVGASVAVPGVSAGTGGEHITAGGASAAAPGVSAGTGAETFVGSGASTPAAGTSAGVGVETFSGAGASLAIEGVSAGTGAWTTVRTGSGASLARPGLSVGRAYAWR